MEIIDHCYSGGFIDNLFLPNIFVETTCEKKIYEYDVLKYMNMMY